MRLMVSISVDSIRNNSEVPEWILIHGDDQAIRFLKTNKNESDRGMGWGWMVRRKE